MLGYLVATVTRDLVRAIAGERARICCTRKTIPGMRALQKYAVRAGGGANHRFGLDDAVLIKDNHVGVAGSVRTAIARAVIGDPRVYVFDEATSSLDSHSEQAILTALNEVSAGRTTLVIAHRLSTIVDADRIVVLDGGRVAEQGRHHDLLARNGLYADMWARQQAEAEESEEAAE